MGVPPKRKQARLALRNLTEIPSADLQPVRQERVLRGARLEALWGVGRSSEEWWPATLLAIYQTDSKASTLPLDDEDFVPLPEQQHEAVFGLICYDARHGYTEARHLVKFLTDSQTSTQSLVLHLTPGEDRGRLTSYRIITGNSPQPVVRNCNGVILRPAPKELWEKRPCISTEFHALYTHVEESPAGKRKRKQGKWSSKVVSEFSFSLGGARAVLSIILFQPFPEAGYDDPCTLYVGFVNPTLNFCELHEGGEMVDYRRLRKDWYRE